MTATLDYRHELKLRDDQLRRDIASQQAVADGRISALDERIKSFIEIQSERDKRMDARFEVVDANVMAIARSQEETRATVSSLKTTVLVTAITSVVAIVIGVYGANAALTSNILAAFQLGRAEQATNIPVAPVVVPPPHAPTLSSPASRPSAATDKG